MLVASAGVGRQGNIAPAVDAIVRQFIVEPHIIGVSQKVQRTNRPFQVTLVEPAHKVVFIANAVGTGRISRQQQAGRFDAACGNHDAGRNQCHGPAPGINDCPGNPATRTQQDTGRWRVGEKPDVWRALKLGAISRSKVGRLAEPFDPIEKNILVGNAIDHRRRPGQRFASFEFRATSLQQLHRAGDVGRDVVRANGPAREIHPGAIFEIDVIKWNASSAPERG